MSFKRTQQLFESFNMLHDVQAKPEWTPIQIHDEPEDKTLPVEKQEVARDKEEEEEDEKEEVKEVDEEAEADEE